MVSVKIWMEISEERLAGNFAALQRILCEDNELGEEISLLAVVKANAYGHGIESCAPILTRAGAKWLGVTDAHEGARVRATLRAAGIAEAEHPEILVMSGTAGLEGEAECIVSNRLTAAVWNTAHITRLAEAARAAGVEEPVRVHLEVDSGMSRQGVAPGRELDAVLKAIAGEPRVTLDGVFTHFASTEIAGSEQTAAQQRSFEAAVEHVVAAALRPRWVHVGNSSYIDNAKASIDNDGLSSLKWLREVTRRVGAGAMVRSGLALYGYVLPIEGPGTPVAGPKVLPVMTWKTRVIGLQEIPVGALVGYNGTFAAQAPMRLALLPVGYADGLRRELSYGNMKTGNANVGGWVVIRGERAPIVGRVSMNLTTVDVSGIAGVAEGDEVVLLGDGVSANDHARIAGTIAYEIVCGVKTAE